MEKILYFVDRSNKRPWLGGSVEKYMLKQIKSKVSDEYSKVFKKSAIQ